jgi:hypothetical protein
MSERAIQTRFVQWIREHYPGVLFCASTGGNFPSVRRRVRNKEEGYSAGFPDLFFYEPKNGFCGLAIELKSLYGRQTVNQYHWQGALEDRGYCYKVARSLEEAKSIFREYIESSDEEHEVGGSPVPFVLCT